MGGGAGRGRTSGRWEEEDARGIDPPAHHLSKRLSEFRKLCGRGIGGQVVIAAVMELDQRPRRPCKDCARALRWRLKLEHDDLARLGFFDVGERLR